MTRAALASLTLAFLPASALAAPGVLKSVCDPTVRAAADDEACACAHKAATAESDAAFWGVDPDYSDWKDGFTMGTVTIDAVSVPAGNNCFELDVRVNPGTAAMRNTFTSRLYGSMTNAAAQFGYSPHFTKSDTDGDFRDDTVGGFIAFGTETSTSGPGDFSPMPGIGRIVDIDPWNAELRTDTGEVIGMTHTGGRDIDGAQTGDFDGNGLLDVRVFLADGAVLDLLGETGDVEFWDISQVQ